MRRMQRCWWAAAALLLPGLAASAQTPPPPPPGPNIAGATAVAARVNGQPIPETAVQRALERVPPAKQAEARKEILDFLIDTVLLDQYVAQLPQFAVKKEQVDEKENEVRAELKKQNKDFNKFLEEMKLSEAELREQIAGDLRWTNYCNAEATDDKLKQLFESDKVLFDGTQVRARHILLTPDLNDPKAVEAAAAQLRGIKKDIEAKVAAGMAKEPSDAPLARENKRRQLTEDAFAEAAKTSSQCPSKAQGGDVDYFQRSGRMVEPFSKAAFALKPFEMSDLVQTQFGVHLILVTDRKQGLTDLQFKDIKDVVKDEFCDRLREQIVAKIKPRAKIEITPAPK